MENQPPEKKWFKKKRYIIPLVILGLILISGGSNDSSKSVRTQGSDYSGFTTTNYVPPTTTKTYVAPQTYQQPVNSGLSNDNYYTNSYGNSVHSPAYSDSIPAGASAQCGDGTYSFSQHRQGTCSHHGGVADWY